jgi:hypothetical protein
MKKSGSLLLCNYDNEFLQPDFQAVCHKTAVDIWAIAVRPAVTGCISLCCLNGVNKIGFFHFAGIDAESLGFHLYFSHIHAFICRFSRRHYLSPFICSLDVSYNISSLFSAILPQKNIV